MNRYQDPNDELNGLKYLTGKKCIDCDRPAGTYWSHLWCQPCNVQRMNKINDSFEFLRTRLDEPDLN